MVLMFIFIANLTKSCTINGSALNTIRKEYQRCCLVAQLRDLPIAYQSFFYDCRLKNTLARQKITEKPLLQCIYIDVFFFQTSVSRLTGIHSYSPLSPRPTATPCLLRDSPDSLSIATYHAPVINISSFVFKG